MTRNSRKSQSQDKTNQPTPIDNADKFEDVIEKIFTYDNPSIKDVLVILREIFNSQQFISTKYDELIKRNMELESMCTKLSRENETIKEELLFLKKEITNVEIANNDRKLEIHGISKQENEDLRDIVIKISENLEQKISKEEIDEIYRIENKTNNKKGNPIVVSFIKKSTKEKFLIMRRKRSLYTNEINLQGSRSQIFINEYLTKRIKELLWKTKKLNTENKFKFIWTKNGMILVRKDEHSEIIKISSQEDLEKLKLQ